MLLRFDLHIHSCFSIDSHSSIEDIVKRAKEAGLDGIAITDHDSIEGVNAAERYVEENGVDLMIIPGIEVTTSKGHILVLGIREKIPRKLSLEETIEKASELGGLIIVPHPFHPFRHGVGDVNGLAVDAIEVFNSRYITGLSNKSAERYAKRLCYPVVAGSDAHVAEAVGFGVTKVDVDRDVTSVLEGIREGRSTFEGSKTPLHTYLYQAYSGFLRRINSYNER
ncbi:MAG: PHP domain-containing protein [Halobacteriota archaeon]|nr:PHP domain-containing protein [Halobacteriota archaeon]